MLTENVDCVWLYAGLANLLVNGVALDVLQLVPGGDAEADVGPGEPASALRGHRPCMVTLEITRI